MPTNLPDGITTVRVTFGKALDSIGEDVAAISANLVLARPIDDPLIWAATGDAFYAKKRRVMSPEGIPWLTFDVIPSDHEGFRDGTQATVTGWPYLLTDIKLKFSDDSVHDLPPRPFQVTKAMAGPNPVDLDLVAKGSITPAVTAPTANVLTVGGIPGPDITLEQLQALGLGGAGGTDLTAVRAALSSDATNQATTFGAALATTIDQRVPSVDTFGPAILEAADAAVPIAVIDELETGTSASRVALDGSYARSDGQGGLIVGTQQVQIAKAPVEQPASTFFANVGNNNPTVFYVPVSE